MSQRGFLYTQEVTSFTNMVEIIGEDNCRQITTVISIQTVIICHKPVGANLQDCIVIQGASYQLTIVLKMYVSQDS
jgi:hypothetical protein